MPETANGLPYPADSDVPDVPADIRALAEALEAMGVRRQYSTVVNVTATNAITGTAPVTWPAGYFKANPRVFVQTVGSAVWVAYLANTPGMASASIGIRHMDAQANSGTIAVHVLAVEP